MEYYFMRSFSGVRIKAMSHYRNADPAKKPIFTRHPYRGKEPIGRKTTR